MITEASPEQLESTTPTSIASPTAPDPQPQSKSKFIATSGKRLWLSIALLGLVIVALPVLYLSFFTPNPLKAILGFNQIKYADSPNYQVDTQSAPQPMTHFSPSQDLLFMKTSMGQPSGNQESLFRLSLGHNMSPQQPSFQRSCYSFQYNLSPDGKYMAQYSSTTQLAVRQTNNLNNATTILGSPIEVVANNWWRGLVPSAHAACGPWYLISTVWSPDSKLLAIQDNASGYVEGGANTIIHLYNIQTGHSQKVYTAPFKSDSSITLLAIQPPTQSIWLLSQTVAAGSNKATNTLLQINYNTGQKIKSLTLEPTDIIERTIDPWPGVITNFRLVEFNHSQNYLYYQANDASRSVSLITGLTGPLGQLEGQDPSDNRWSTADGYMFIPDIIHNNPTSSQAFVYGQKEGQQQKEYGILDYGSHTVQQLTVEAEKSDFQAQWSADGAYLALFSPTDKRLYVVDAKQSKVVHTNTRADFKDMQLLGWVTKL